MISFSGVKKGLMPLVRNEMGVASGSGRNIQSDLKEPLSTTKIIHSAIGHGVNRYSNLQILNEFNPYCPYRIVMVPEICFNAISANLA